MGFFSRSNTNSSSTTSQSQNTGGSQIQTVITERSDQPYVGGLQDVNMPAFTRTGSYYQYLQASDVRRQVQEAPSRNQANGPYPKHYNNRPPQPLRAQPPHSEYPIVPSPQNGSPPGNYTNGKPGPVRAFYNESNRSEFDVGYHDPKLPPSGPRNGSSHARHPFSPASYHPASDYIDTSTLKRS